MSNLVLSRHRGESIRIGDDVVITVQHIRGNKVRLSVNAPRHLRVDRDEVWKKRLIARAAVNAEPLAEHLIGEPLS